MTTKRDSKSKPQTERPKLKKEKLRDLDVQGAEGGRVKAGGIDPEATEKRHKTWNTGAGDC